MFISFVFFFAQPAAKYNYKVEKYPKGRSLSVNLKKCLSCVTLNEQLLVGHLGTHHTSFLGMPIYYKNSMCLSNSSHSCLASIRSPAVHIGRCGIEGCLINVPETDVYKGGVVLFASASWITTCSVTLLNRHRQPPPNCKQHLVSHRVLILLLERGHIEMPDEFFMMLLLLDARHVATYDTWDDDASSPASCVCATNRTGNSPHYYFDIELLHTS